MRLPKQPEVPDAREPEVRGHEAAELLRGVDVERVHREGVRGEHPLVIRDAQREDGKTRGGIGFPPLPPPAADEIPGGPTPPPPLPRDARREVSHGAEATA